VKTIRKVELEPRFSNCTEVDEQKGRPDMAKREIFIHENAVAISKLPVKKFNQNWLKQHLPSLQKDPRSKTEAKTLQSYIKNNTS
jgi:hypothetical protein